MFCSLVAAAASVYWNSVVDLIWKKKTEITSIWMEDNSILFFLWNRVEKFVFYWNSVVCQKSRVRDAISEIFWISVATHASATQIQKKKN